MLPGNNILEQARKARDPRFDGRFFVGVKTTGIYCRPVCPVKMPKAENVEFYESAAAASEAGFRPCLRCRPETAPGTPAWRGTSTTVSRGLKLIEEGALDEGSVTQLADRLGVTTRHLSRLFAQHLGASPKVVALTRRLQFAKQLIDSTSLSLTEIALAAGYGSLRRFNDHILSVYGRSPTQMRKQEVEESSSKTNSKANKQTSKQSSRKRGREVTSGRASGITSRRASASATDTTAANTAEKGGFQPLEAVILRLPYREPYDLEGLLAFFAMRATPGVERVSDGVYQRALSPSDTGDTDGGSASGTGGGQIRVSRGDQSAQRSAQEAKSTRAGSLPNSRPQASLLKESLLKESLLKESLLKESLLKPSHLKLEVFGASPGALMSLCQRVRRMFDLDAIPDEITATFKKDKGLYQLAKSNPGQRLPGGWDSFEVAVRAIVGQQVSVKGATTVMGRIAEIYGTPGACGFRSFPAPEVLAELDEASLPMPGARAAAIKNLARAVATGEISLSSAQDSQRFQEQLVTLKGNWPLDGTVHCHACAGRPGCVHARRPGDSAGRAVASVAHDGGGTHQSRRQLATLAGLCRYALLAACSAAKGSAQEREA